MQKESMTNDLEQFLSDLADGVEADDLTIGNALLLALEAALILSHNHAFYISLIEKDADNV